MFNLGKDKERNRKKEYKIIEFGGPAIISEINRSTKDYIIVVESLVKVNEIDMNLESIWNFDLRKNRFDLELVILEVEKMDLCAYISSVPRSHIEALKKWETRS